MPATKLVVAACVSVFSVGRSLPKTCSAYNECGHLLGDCCPNKDGVMLDCCILGAVRMSAEALEDAANKTKARAAEVSKEADEAAARAAALEKEAEEKKAAVKEAHEAYAEAEHAAEDAKAEYAKTSKLISESKCENNPACDEAGLTGFCCPTLVGMALNGTMLGCCGGGGGAPARAAAALPGEPLAAVSLASEAQDLPKTCSAYDECGALQGDCCPNAEGVMLSCCILGAVRMEAEAKEAAANKTKAAYEKAEHDAEEAKAEYAETAKLITEAKCENHPACVKAGVTGFCCPTLVGMALNGTMLGCCGGGGDASAQLAALPEESRRDGPRLLPLAAAAAAAAGAAALAAGARRCRGEAHADGYVFTAA